MSIPEPNSIDGAIRHVLQLLRQHSEFYVGSYVENSAGDLLEWRSRYNELRQELARLEFMRDFPLP
ncbi:hypothetical protein FNL55_13175 [Tardiphaga sp. vice352]|uniref:hypothetical protein n=1 Tax=unclassified Tardiphaga TaxID=2631404 RepID=UPI001161E649|nr:MULTISPECIES: hypothetical protein [unclassified Tardiphaga]QDM16842.1 hypothetical protein FNL53_13555 [Tardiphaga sp. vice278]QDM32183.1 hypothetical protein FNL55_13175 [Tardiphaga sp. vice352]